VAEYNVDIQVRAKTQQATKGLTDVEAQITGIIKKTEQAERRFKGLGQALKGFGGLASSNVKAYGKSLSVLDKQLGGLGKRLGDVAQAFDFGGKTVVGVAGINAVANAAAGLSGRFSGPLGAIRDFGSGLADLTAPVNAVTSALQAMGPAGMATAGGIAAATAAFMAFAPAAAKAVGPAAGRRVQELAGSFNRLDEEIKATAGSFESLIKGSTLNQLNAQLEDAKRQVGEYRSNTEEARISAQQLVAVTKQQAIEQRAINDLVRQAKGITQTELEEAKAVKSLKVAKKREEILKKETKAAKESAEATRRREEALSQEARERTAATIAKRQKALEEETRRTQEAIKANYELGRAQDILADKRANAVLEMARQRRMAGTTMYGPGGAGPATAGFAANVEAARQVDAQNKAFAEGAKQRIEWEKKVNEISTSLQKELNSLRTKHRRERYFREIKLAEQAAKYVEGLERKAAQRAESLALGVGFPLLFGGGVGSVAGGALGSVIGSQGFGGQIIFSAIGQQIDTVVANVAKLGQALNPLTLDLDAVTTAAGISGTALEKYLKELESTAGKAKAAEEAQKALAAVVGDEGIDALEEFGEATQNLSNAFDRAMSRMAAGVARLINSIPGFLQFTSNLERGGVLQRALASTDPAQAGNLQLLEQARVGTGGVDIGKQQSAIEALIRTQRTIEAGGGSAQDMTILKRQLEVDKARVALAKAGSDLADDAVFKARQQLQIKEHALRIEEVSQKDLTDAAQNAEFEKLALRDERERVQLANDRAAALSKVTKKGAKEGERVAKEVALLKIRNGLIGTMLTLDTQIADAKRQGRVEDVEALQRSKVLLQGMAKEEELRVRIKDAGELAAKVDENNLATRTELAKLDQGKSDRIQAETEAVQSTLNGLDMQLEKVNAVSDSEKDALQLRQIELDLLGRNITLTERERKEIQGKIADIRAATEARKEEEFIQQNINNLVNTAGQQFTNLFQTLINGTNSWNDALRNTLNTLANALVRFGINALGGSDGVGFFSMLAGTFSGGRAQGGSVGSGRSYLVGEQGPELFMPKASGTIVPNHALGGGTANIVVNVDATGSSAEGNAQDSKRLGEAIGVAIRQELIKQKRPGGLLA
jgi:hypothetical protein